MGHWTPTTVIFEQALTKEDQEDDDEHGGLPHAP